MRRITTAQRWNMIRRLPPTQFSSVNTPSFRCRRFLRLDRGSFLSTNSAFHTGNSTFDAFSTATVFSARLNIASENILSSNQRAELFLALNERWGLGVFPTADSMLAGQGDLQRSEEYSENVDDALDGLLSDTEATGDQKSDVFDGILNADHENTLVALDQIAAELDALLEIYSKM